MCNALHRRGVPVEYGAPSPAARSGSHGAGRSASRRIIMPSALGPVQARSVNSPPRSGADMPDGRAGGGRVGAAVPDARAGRGRVGEAVPDARAGLPARADGRGVRGGEAPRSGGPGVTPRASTVITN